MGRPFSRLGELAVVLLGVGVVALAGMLAASSGEALLVGIGGIIVVMLFLVRPDWGLSAVAALLPIQNVFVVSSGVTLSKVVGAAVFVAWGGRKLLTGESFRGLVSSAYFWAGGLFVAFAFASELWARVPGLAVGGAQQLLLVFGLGVIVVDVVRSWPIAERIVKALILGGLAAAAMTLGQSITGSAPAGDDISGGVNATPSLLVTLIPVGFYLLRRQESRVWRTAGLFYLVMAPTAIVATFSRFNLLVLPLVFIPLCIDAWIRKGGKGWVLGLAVVAVLGGSIVLPWNSVRERVSSIPRYFAGEVRSTGMAVGFASERGYHLRVGLAIASDYPIFGAGYENYGVLFRDDYQYRVPGRTQTFGVRNPHSSHIGILANLGIVGTVFWWALLVGAGLGSVLAAMKVTAVSGQRSPYLFVRAVGLGLALQIFAYGWYSSNDRFPLLWVMLALSSVAVGLAKDGTGARSEVLRRREEQLVSPFRGRHDATTRSTYPIAVFERRRS